MAQLLTMPARIIRKNDYSTQNYPHFLTLAGNVGQTAAYPTNIQALFSLKASLTVDIIFSPFMLQAICAG
jgi:hypothetical protein